MPKLTIKTTNKGTEVFIDDKKIDAVYAYSVSQEAGEIYKATISFYPTEIDMDLQNK
ncbi:MAG: hypothetical protein ACI4KR_13745 [Ruminiclostridium sp.]